MPALLSQTNDVFPHSLQYEVFRGKDVVPPVVGGITGYAKRVSLLFISVRKLGLSFQTHHQHCVKPAEDLSKTFVLREGRGIICV
jgi:hypothetical protein